MSDLADLTSPRLLEGRVAVVTGAAAGIGEGIVETFTAHGATVVAVDVDGDRLHDVVDRVVANDGLAVPVGTDVREPREVDALVARTLDELGTLDVLVNNVGDFLGTRGDFVDSREEDWDDLYAINLRSAFLCSRAALRPMLQAQQGAVINVSSVEGFRGIPGLVAYGTFKGAVDAFTKSLAVEVAPSGVRVNAIAPDKVQSVQTSYEQRWSPEQLAAVGQWIPAGRLGRPADVAGAALFLASDLSSFVTGTTVHVDGGTWAAGGWYRTPSGRWTNTPPMRDDA